MLIITPISEVKVFEEAGIFSVESPETDYVWRKVQDITFGEIKGANYSCTKAGSTKAAVLTVERRKVDSDVARRATLKGHYNGLVDGMEQSKFSIIEKQAPKLDSPIPDVVPFTLKVQTSNNTKLFVYCKTIFGTNTFLLQVSAPSDDDAKKFYDAISKSFREIKAAPPKVKQEETKKTGSLDKSN
jgi:hypothetical protein